MPQGGIDKGEEPWAAALRELEEETGIPPRLVEQIADHPQQLRYDIPDAIAAQAVGRQVEGTGPGLVSGALPGRRQRHRHRHRRARILALAMGRAAASFPS